MLVIALLLTISHPFLVEIRKINALGGYGHLKCYACFLDEQFID